MVIRGANFWIGLLLLIFSLGLLPGLVPPEDPNPKLRELAEYSVRNIAPGDVETRYGELMAEQRTGWIRNVGLTAASVVAIWLTLARSKAGLWCAALVCLLMLLVYVPPLLPDLLSGRFLRTAGLVYQTMSPRGLLGMITFWHIAVAPFAYLLLGIAAVAIAACRRGANVR